MATSFAANRSEKGFLLAATIAAYANSFCGTFQFDDLATIFKDPHLKSLPAFISHMQHTIRPFLKLTFLLDLRLFAGNPFGFHLLNFLLHIGSGFLVYYILSNLLNRTTSDCHFNHLKALPFWTALLFLNHPIATETVTYISGRATGLMAFFYLASFFLYIRSTENEEAFKRFSLPYIGSLFCFILALLSKEIAIMLPFTLLLYDLLFTRRNKHLFIRLHLPFWLILVLFLLIGFLNPTYSYLFNYSQELRPIYENLVTQINTIAYSLSLFFIPARLNFDHDLPHYHSILEWPTPISLFIIIFMIAIALFSIKKRPLLSFGISFFFLTLVPTNSILPRYDLLSERNLYLPSTGLFLAAVFAFVTVLNKFVPYIERECCQRQRIIGKGRTAITFLIIFIPLFLVYSTIKRNTVYKDQVAFWEDAAKKSPLKARPHNNLGYAYYVKGDLDHAIEEFRIALAIDRYFPGARQNLLQAWELKKDRSIGQTR